MCRISLNLEGWQAVALVSLQRHTMCSFLLDKNLNTWNFHPLCKYGFLKSFLMSCILSTFICKQLLNIELTGSSILTIQHKNDWSNMTVRCAYHLLTSKCSRLPVFVHCTIISSLSKVLVPSLSMQNNSPHTYTWLLEQVFVKEPVCDHL